jgi:hypothetical protein
VNKFGTKTIIQAAFCRDGLSLISVQDDAMLMGCSSQSSETCSMEGYRVFCVCVGWVGHRGWVGGGGVFVRKSPLTYWLMRMTSMQGTAPVGVRGWFQSQGKV